MNTTNTGSVTASEGKIVTLTRVFRFGSINLPDPNPALTPEEVVSLYTPNYPLLETATLGEPFVEGDELIHPVLKAEVKTKG
jgi:PRTRC genetic system protein C